MSHKMTTFEKENDLLNFTKKAEDHFTNNPEHTTFGNLEQGSYLALRWGLGGDCVLVLKLDEDFQPINYQQLIKRK